MSTLAIGIRGPLIRRVPIRCFTNKRFNSTKDEPLRLVKKKTKKVSSAELRKQRNKLAMTSMKDIFGSFMGNSSDDEVYEIDPKPIYADPRKFLTLNQLLQQCVLDDLTKQLKKKWVSIPLDVKRFHYFLSYGNYGPRDLFPAIDSPDQPLDLPFAAHSISEVTPNAMTKVHKQIYNLNLHTLGPLRVKQAKKDATMDPFSKFIIFTFILLTLLNFKRDSRVQSSGKIPVNTYQEQLLESKRLEQELLLRYEEERKREQDLKEQEEQRLSKNNTKKWYYLWLK